MLIRTIAISLVLVCAGCDYQPVDRGQPDQIAHDRSGAALTFGDIDQVDGTRFFTIPIVRIEHGGSDSFSGSYRGGDERNRLIVDGTTGATRRVLPNTDFSIVNWIEPKAEMIKTDIEKLKETAGDNKASPSGIYAAVVKRPGRTNKDPATYDLLFGRFEDGKQTWVASGLAGVQAVWLTPDGKLGLVAATTKGGVFRLYDPSSFQQLLDAPLKL